MTASWEYMYLTELTNAQENMVLRLSALGSLGWEVCGFASADPTIGFNAYTAILKRQVASLTPPEDVAAGWREDPSQRGDHRYWDGFRWSEHITKDGVTSTDWPNVRAA